MKIIHHLYPYIKKNVVQLVPEKLILPLQLVKDELKFPYNGTINIIIRVYQSIYQELNLTYNLHYIPQSLNIYLMLYLDSPLQDKNKKVLLLYQPLNFLWLMLTLLILENKYTFLSIHLQIFYLIFHIWIIILIFRISSSFYLISIT